MTELRINGITLILSPETEAQLEERHPIVKEELSDAFTLPVTVPIRGNEAVLGHVHLLPLRERKLRITGAEWWEDGVPKHLGVFYVEGSTDGPDGTVSLSFSVDGFISGMAGKRLRDVDFGEDIVFADALTMLTDAIARNDESYPEARYCYPMIYNPDAYGSENPDFFQNIPDYEAATDYNVNDVIRYTKDEPVRRDRAFICIGDAPPGENPDNTPGDWQPYGQALINPWSPTLGEFKQNSSLIGNRCAMCPQFYGKDVLIRAMADIGLTAVGAFLDDPATHQWVLYNNQLLDEVERLHRLLASVTTPITWASGVGGRVFKAQDDFTLPNEDVDSRYDPATGHYDCATAGPYTFRVRVKMSMEAPRVVGVRVVRASDGVSVASALSSYVSGDWRTQWDSVMTLSVIVAPGDEGEYYVLVSPTISGSSLLYAATLQSGSYLEVYQGSPDLVNTYAKRIHPVAHVPDITIEHLLLDVRDWFHVRIIPQPELGVVRFDYQQDILTQPIARDLSAEVRSHVSMDHTSRVTGIRLKNPTGRKEELPDLSGHFDDGAFESEAELPAPAADLHRAHVRNTGQLLISKLYNTNQYAWFPAGMLCNDAEVGDMTNPRDVAPEFGAPEMDLVPATDGSICLMPVIQEKCSSPLFGMGNNPPGLYFMYYLGLQKNAEGNTYPLATPFGRAQTDEVIGRPALVPTLSLVYDARDPRSHFIKFWAQWAAILATAEPFLVDMDMSAMISRKRIPLERFMLQNQVVIFDTLPSEYTTTEGVPIVPQVRFLRLPPP